LRNVLLALAIVAAVWLASSWFRNSEMPVQPGRPASARPKPKEADGDVNFRRMEWIRYLMPEVQKTSPEAVKVYSQVEALSKAGKHQDALKLAETIQPLDESRDQEIYMKALLWTSEGIARAGNLDHGLEIIKKLPEPGLSMGLHKMAEVAADRGQFQKARHIIEQIKLENIRHLAFKSLRGRQAWLESYDQWCKRLIGEPESKEVLGWLKPGNNTLGEFASKLLWDGVN